MKLLLSIYLLYSASRLFVESIYTYYVILNYSNINFRNLKSPLLKFINTMTIISMIYFILQFRWIYSGLYLELGDFDEILWSMSEGLMLFTLANMCSIIRRISKFQ